MALNVQKGGRALVVNKDGKALSKIRLGLSWGENPFDTGHDFDPDVSIVALKDGIAGFPYGKGYGEDYVIYFQQPTSPKGEIKHGGDDTKGGLKSTDNETITVDLDALPAGIDRLAVLVTIYEGAERKQNFGMMPGAKIKLYDDATGEVVLVCDLDEDLSASTASLFIEIYRKDGQWRMRNVNEGFNQGIGDFFRLYGFDVQ